MPEAVKKGGVFCIETVGTVGEMGGVRADFMCMGADWLVAMLNRKYERGMDRRFYFEKDGTIKEGDGRPPWWEGSATAKKRTKRKK